MSEELNNGDAWIIKRVDPIEPDESNWGQDDESILEALDGYLQDLSDGEYNDLVSAMGEVPLEVRLALLFLKAAFSDGTLDAIEVDTIASYLQPVLDQLGSTVSTNTLIQNSKKRLIDHDLIDSSINLLNEQLSNAVLAGILNQIIALASVDDKETNQEDRWIERLASSWQLEIGEVDATDADSATEGDAAEEDDATGEEEAVEDGDDGESDEDAEQAKTNGLAKDEGAVSDAEASQEEMELEENGEEEEEEEEAGEEEADEEQGEWDDEQADCESEVDEAEEEEEEEEENAVEEEQEEESEGENEAEVREEDNQDEQ